MYESYNRTITTYVLLAHGSLLILKQKNFNI